MHSKNWNEKIFFERKQKKRLYMNIPFLFSSAYSVIYKQFLIILIRILLFK